MGKECFVRDRGKDNIPVLLRSIQDRVFETLGVPFEDILHNRSARRVYDACTAYIFAVYNFGLMNGVELAKHLRVDHTSVYYHLRKWYNLRETGAFGVEYGDFEEAIRKEVKTWQKETRSH